MAKGKGKGKRPKIKSEKFSFKQLQAVLAKNKGR